MNILHLLRFIPNFIGEMLFELLCFILGVLGFIFILPFCKKEDTFDAEDRWFAWYPIIIGIPKCEINLLESLRNFRWLVFVGREFTWDGPIYKDLEEEK